MEPDRAPLILFVCTGDQIRSPLAAAIFKRRLNEFGFQDKVRVESAGTWTIPGQSVHLARVTARRMGLDIEQHRSRPVAREVLLEARLVIVMEHDHKEALEIEYPQVRGRIHLLTQLAGEPPSDIPDPAGQDLQAHLQTGQELLSLINSAFDTICLLVEER
jgi:protein-tyrosine phosphatase